MKRNLKTSSQQSCILPRPGVHVTIFCCFCDHPYIHMIRYGEEHVESEKATYWVMYFVIPMPIITVHLSNIFTLTHFDSPYISNPKLLLWSDDATFLPVLKCMKLGKETEMNAYRFFSAWCAHLFFRKSLLLKRSKRRLSWCFSK